MPYSAGLVRVVGVGDHADDDLALEHPCLDALDLAPRLERQHRLQAALGGDDADRHAGAGAVVEGVVGVLGDRAEEPAAALGHRGAVGEAEGDAVGLAEVVLAHDARLRRFVGIAEQPRLERGPGIADDRVRPALVAALQQHQVVLEDQRALDVHLVEAPAERLVERAEVDHLDLAEQGALAVEAEQRAAAAVRPRARAEREQRAAGAARQRRQVHQASPGRPSSSCASSPNRAGRRRTGAPAGPARGSPGRTRRDAARRRRSRSGGGPVAPARSPR